jgi:hypothetical protein
VSDAVQRSVETQRPQDGDVNPDRNTGPAKFERVEGVAIDAGLGGNLGDRHPAPRPGQAFEIAMLFDARGGLGRDGFSHNIRR